jgi:Set1/Ash2 histone methyltransferase complex subunit ASH2
LSQSKRGSKRKTSETSNNAGGLAGAAAGMYTFGSANFNTKKRGGGANDLARLEKMVPVCFPSDHPYNKDGYRYHLVEPDPHSPMRQKFEETELWAGKPLPGHLYRLFLENKIAFALHDRAPQLKLSDDRMCVTGDKGYSMIRATHGASHGSWYFEVTIKEKPNASAAFRIGWAQPLSNLQAPCGYDKFSYSWRSRKGTVFHDSIGKSYSKLFSENSVDPGYGLGDTLGFYIHLPPSPHVETNNNDNSNNIDNKSAEILPESCKEMTLVKFKNHLYYEEKDNFSEVEKKLTPLIGSKVKFYFIFKSKIRIQ